MVMQERLFFRNIPLSNWIEHEMVVEEGRDLDQLPKESVFTASTIAASNNAPSSLGVASPMASAVSSLKAGEGRLPVPDISRMAVGEGRLPISKMLDEFDAPPPKPVRESVSLIHTRVVAFGAQ